MKKYQAILSITPALIILDQITKLLIVLNLRRGESITVIPGIFDIVHHRNTGAAFGMLADWNPSLREPFFYLITLVAITAMLLFYRKLPESKRLLRIALSLILSGALGNLIDRFLRGSVVDFLSFHWYNQSVAWDFFGHHFETALIWPAFNVADSTITMGAFVILWDAWREGKK